MSSRRSVLDESPAFDPSLHRPMMPAGRSGSLTFVNLSSASSLFSNPSPPVSGGGPPHSGGGGAMMAPMSGGSSIGGMPPLMPNVVSPAAGHHPHHHQAQAAYPQQASPMGSWGFPTNAATSLQAPLQPAVLHQPHSQHHPHQQGMPTPMQPQPVYQPYQQQHPSMQPQAPFSLGGPPGSQGPYGHLPSPLQPTPVGGHPAAQHQQHLAYGGGGLHYASPPTSQSSGGSPSHSSYSSPPSSTSSSSTSSPSPSSTSTMMAGGVGFGYGGVGVGVGVGSGGGNGSFRLDEAQERMRQQHEQIRAEERLKQQQLHVKMLQEEQQRHLREEQERERIEAEKRKAEREALRQEEERKRLEAQREQERQQEALRAEQMRIFEEVRQAQLRLQHEQELQHQRQQLEQFEQQQKVIQEQQRQQEQLRLERIRFEEEQRREEEAARLQQERVKQEEERKRQDLLRQEQLRQEQFALEQKRREEALQEKRRQEQLLLAQQEKLRREQEEVEQEKLRAEQRLNSERMQQEKERLAEEVRLQQERLRLAQEEIQREKEKMAIELMREQQRIQEERQRLQAEHEKLRQERVERERLEEESRVRHQERVRQHQEQLARQQEAIRQQQQQHVAHMRQQQEQMMRSQPQPQAQLQPQPQVSRTQTAPILSRRPTPQVPPVPTNASSWSPFGPSSSASSAEERPGEMKPRPRASVGSAILSRPPPHGSGTGSPNKASTLDSPFGGTSAAGGSAIHRRPTSPPNAAQQGTRHPRKPRHPGAPAPIGALPGGQEQRIQADAMASYEAYAAEIARKHRVSDRAEIMTADTMFDSSAFENKLELYEDHNEQRSAYYDDSSDDENGFYNGNKRSETNPPQPRSGSILGVRSPQQQPAGRTLISHKTGPAATSGSAVPPKRVPKPMVALRTGPAGAPSHWEKDAGGVKAKDAPGARPLPSVPGDHNRRRSTGSAEGEDGDDDDNNERNGGNAEKKSGLRALVKHHTGALKRSPRAPIYNDTEQQPPPPQHSRSAGFSHLNASVDSAHALIEELQEVAGHKEEGQPRSAPLPRVVRQLPTPSHTSPPPATPPRSASKSLPPVPAKNPPTAAGRQLPPKKAPLPPVPRKALSREEAALIFQTRWRSSRVRRQYTQITLRTRVAREIYSSELVYVQSLGVTIDVFLKPLRRAAEQGKPIILSADIASVFGNLEEIYAYHLQMVSKLESRITRWNVETQIGDTFLDMKQDFIMLYSSYINHYDQALETIGRCKDLKTWRAFIQRCNQHPECGGLSLESFLILPVQRVTRYVILLRDLRQKTPENHVDYQNINAAQTYMDNICYQVNENKRSAENLKKQMDVLASLQAKMKPKDMVRDLVDQNRVFVKQVVVTLYDQDSDKRREVCLFVFNDQLLVTKGDIKKDRFQIIAKFTRDDINFRLEIMADTDDFMGQQIKNAFVLHTPRVSYLFFCISTEERNLLFEQIRSIFR